ncbi:MAG: potassium transporter TrkG [Planktomarina sp.]
MKHLLKAPLVLALAWIVCFSMLIPSGFAFLVDHPTAGRTFLYAALLGIFLCSGIILALSNRRLVGDSRSLLLTLFSFFVLFPMWFALPVAELIASTTYFHAYLDMVSALTTTALPTYEDERLFQTLALWRAQVAWMGGLFMWTAAAVLFQPLQIGGYEVNQIAKRLGGRWEKTGGRTTTQRFFTELRHVGNLYFSLTFLAALFFWAFGVNGFSAVIYAMGAISTAGYSYGVLGNAVPASLPIELILFAVMFLSLTRRSFGERYAIRNDRDFWRNGELRVGLAIVLFIGLVIFTKHASGAATVDNVDDPFRAWAAFWGAIFTALSFLTTTGYVAEGWYAAQNWSGYENSGVVLLGLAIIGGGAATSAGGIKLTRIARLLRHSEAEIKLLTSPHRVVPNTQETRKNALDNDVTIWLFFMLFFFALAAMLVWFGLSRVNFTDSIALATASLTNTGPLVHVAASQPIEVLSLGAWAKIGLIVAMVVGRLETLAFVALLNPELWRK